MTNVWENRAKTFYPKVSSTIKTKTVIPHVCLYRSNLYLMQQKPLKTMLTFQSDIRHKSFHLTWISFSHFRIHGHRLLQVIVRFNSFVLFVWFLIYSSLSFSCPFVCLFSKIMFSVHVPILFLIRFFVVPSVRHWSGKMSKVETC